MEIFNYISVIALFGYTLMFLMFASAKKNKIINAYLLVLIASIGWTGGSCLMRMQAWPSYELWYNISVCALLIFVYALFHFICSFAGKSENILSIVWLLLTLAACIINFTTGFFLNAPNIIQAANGNVTYEYEMTWRVSFLFILTGGIMIHMLFILLSSCKKDKLFRYQVEPTIFGMIIMFVGNLALLIPGMKGFPIDILAGLINVLLMFYALTRRKLFRLKFLASEGICYAMALMATILLFMSFGRKLIDLFENYFAWMRDRYIMVFAVLMVIVAMIFLSIWKKIINETFVREEEMQKECLQEFSLSISRSLRLMDIYESIIGVVKKTMEVDGIYICRQEKHTAGYKIVYTDSDLKAADFELKADHPVVAWLREKEDFLFLKEFMFSVNGKAMWEDEKEVLLEHGIEYAMALKDKDELVGLMLFSNKDGKATVTQKDTAFLEAVGSIASIAIKNSILYEKAYTEAVTDELTGLYNRRYFTEKLDKLFEECKKSSLALVLISIDDFKLYNQLYGVCEGDNALQKIAGIMKASVGENGYVARYSGKEFAVLLPQYDVLGAKMLAESISEQINLMNSNKKNYAIRRLTASIGISAYPYGAHNVKELLNNVDMSVYYVKQHGKNAINVFDITSSVDNTAATDEAGAELKPQSVYMEYESTIYALTAAINTKDNYTFRHSNNVAYYATTLAAALDMNSETIEIVRQAALLHDVGKIGIPEQILNKAGKLTTEEYEQIKGHVEASIGIIRHLPSLDYVIPAVIGHHERYDGCGYPRQIAGENIPATARILCIADSFDAIVSKRCYKDSVPLEEAIVILRKEAGHQFDPEMVEVFCRLLETEQVKIAANEEMLAEN